MIRSPWQACQQNLAAACAKPPSALESAIIVLIYIAALVVFFKALV